MSFRLLPCLRDRPLLSKYCRWAKFADRLQRLHCGPSRDTAKRLSYTLCRPFSTDELTSRGQTIIDKKIIYLGFHKSGTTSFWKFFSKHGFRVIHNTLQVCESIGLDKKLESGEDLRTNIDTCSLDKFVEKYDVLTDNPFPVLYEYFDKYYAESLFVLGTRPTDKWLSSMQRFFGTRMPALGHAIYTSDENPCSDPEALTSTYEKHNLAVREYFRGHDKFMEIRIGVDSDLKITKDLEDFVGLPKNQSIVFEKHLPK